MPLSSLSCRVCSCSADHFVVHQSLNYHIHSTSYRSDFFDDIRWFVLTQPCSEYLWWTYYIFSTMDERSTKGPLGGIVAQYIVRSQLFGNLHQQQRFCRVHTVSSNSLPFKTVDPIARQFGEQTVISASFSLPIVFLCQEFIKEEPLTLKMPLEHLATGQWETRTSTGSRSS